MILRIRVLFLIVIVALVAAYCAEHLPAPDPTPDDPGPSPSGSLRVLIVEETSQRSTLPPAQAIAITSGEVRDYLNSHCDKERGTATWRIYDKDQDVTNETKAWQDEFAVLKDEDLPTIAIKSGSRRWTKPQPLPKDTDSLLRLLKRYGGA